MLHLLSESRTAEAVNEGVAATVAHGKPMGDEKYQIDVFKIVYAWDTQDQDEVNLVWKPADTENEQS